MPGLLSGYQEGRASARTADIQQQRTDELKAQNAWDRDFKTHKSIMDFGAKLPMSQRPDYYKKAFGNKSPDMAEMYSTASQEQVDEINKATNEMNTKRKNGEDVSDSIAKLDALGVPKAITDQYKDANKVDVEQRKEEKHNEYVQQAYNIYKSGGEVTDDEVGVHASILKADPTALAEGSKLYESEKKAGGTEAGKKVGSTFELKKDNKILTYEVTGTNPDGTSQRMLIAEAPRLASETGTDLTSEALDIASLALLESGAMPAVGRTSRIRVQILNNAPKIAKEYGLEPTDLSLAGRKMVYDSNKKALADLTSRKVQVLAFEETANKNLDIVRELSKEVDRTGTPMINAWINAGRRAITGNVELSKFDAALRVAINEVAKITSSATGGAVTSDTARKEFEDLLTAAQTPQQVAGVIDVLQADMNNRIAGFETQTEETKEAVRLFNPKKKRKGTAKTAEQEAADFLEGK